MRNAPGLVGANLAVVAAATVFLAVPAWADALLSGSIKSAAGEAIGGVTVSAKANGSNITTTVFTDDGGHYYFPPLPNAKYKVWAQAMPTTPAAATSISPAKATGFHAQELIRRFLRQLPGD